MTAAIDYNKIMSDRNQFNQFVYTPLSEALRLLEERRKNPEILEKIQKLLNGDVPEFLKNKKCAILGRHLATPNNESRMFMAVAKENSLHPIFFEYHNDKFTSNNEFKHSLGQLIVKNKEGENADQDIEKINIVDFNLHNGKKIKNVKTLWDEPLADFHRKLFAAHGYKIDDYLIFDASEWFKDKGEKAIDYYANLLLLFTCYGILFENFLISKNTEGDFTKKVVLPAIEKVIAVSGIKPLIVPLEPFDLETDSFWVHHLPKVRKMIPKY